VSSNISGLHGNQEEEKKWFKPKAMLKVTYVGEPAVDDGGPKRDFFLQKSLVISDAHSSVMMVSPFNADMRAVANDEFKVVGELMACPLFKGGMHPVFCL